MKRLGHELCEELTQASGSHNLASLLSRSRADPLLQNLEWRVQLNEQDLPARRPHPAARLLGQLGEFGAAGGHLPGGAVPGDEVGLAAGRNLEEHKPDATL